MSSLDRRGFLGTTGAMVAGGLVTQQLAAAEAAEKTIGVGLVGVGGRGTALLQNLLKVKGVTVRAICDIKPDHLARAQKIVTDAGQKSPAGTAEWKKLVEMPEVDAVVSALPCDLHAANYVDVITADKDLYGEKPMCLTAADCDRVVNATKKHDRIVQIGFQRRADPRFVETVAQIHQGELGDLIEGRILWSNSWGPLLDWFGKRERSGDWMVEQAVHNWDVMNWSNRCLPVRAMGLGRSDLFRDRQSDRNVHDYYAAVVEYDNGVIVNIIHSWVVPGKLNGEYTQLAGNKAGIDFNSGTFSYRKELGKPDRVGHSHSGDINSTLLALQSWVDSVRTRKQPVSTVEHGRDAVLACLLVREAVYRKKVVELSDVLA